MEKFAWKGYVKEGFMAEYEKRHDDLWPEIAQVLENAGIKNYTIWNIGNELFGYYECESIAHAQKVQNESPAMAKWEEYMSDILIKEKAPENSETPLMKQVFKFR